jgi:DNA-binding transcriptional LysR family regulator
MEAKYLTQLAVIVELGSVTKAAQKLNVTQPTLSRTVKIIEDRVGGPVLRRERYGVSATEIGAKLAEEGREIMHRSDRARTAIQQWKHGLSGEIRIGVGPMLGATVMGDFFAQSLIDPPVYGFKVVCETAAKLVDGLHNDLLDVAIIPFELNRSEQTLHREMLFHDRLSIFVGQDDPLVGKRAVTAQALSQHHWISVDETSGLFGSTRDVLDLLGLTEVTPAIECTGDVNMIFRMLEKSNACAVVPFRLLGAFQQRFNIAAVDLDVELETRNVGLWTTKEGRDRPEIIDLLGRLNSYFSRIGLV